MESFLHKDHLLLGHGPRRSFSSPQIPFRNSSSSSDVDFNDVFGGPPRRSSMNYNWHQGVGDETEDSQVFRGRGGGEEEEEEEKKTVAFRDPWTGLSEKPVFGEERLNRRRRQTNDFYDDIFRGEERKPLSSTPKKPGLDPFSSTPASRILSPARPLPPQTEPFLSSSLPSLLSLQGKYTKEMDFPAPGTAISSSRKNKAGDLNGLGSPISSSTTMSRFSPQVIPGEDGSRNYPRTLYRQSSLSKDFSFNKFETTDQGLCKKKSNMSHINDSCGKFHFSIYKWASKGVPIAMLLQGRNSSRAKEHTPVSLGEQLSSSENNLEANGSLRSECENQDYTLVTSSKKNDRIDSSQSVEEVSSAKPESKSVTNLQGAILETPRNHVPHNTGKEIRSSFGAPLNVYSSMGTATEKLVSSKEEHKPELKPLHRLFKDDSTRQGNVITVEQPRVKESKGQSTHTSVRGVDESKRVLTGNGKILNLKKENNSKLQDSPTDSEENLVSNKVKGKVKEFVKIFNQEAPMKPLNNTGFGLIEKNVLKVEDHATIGATRAEMEEQLINATDNGKLTETTIMVDQALKESAKPPLSINSTAFKIDDASYGGKDSSLCSGSIQSFESVIDNIEESHIADPNCQVEELPHEEDIRPQNSQNGLDQEKIQDSDARIRHWSTGKEGSIRSLLSTLQYVLWPESGWKPVPLVDIIEGNSVKRAYQKALLCLHPDKLQQKGAEPHQKYIAEKVFDILQEAWTHFNVLGSF